MADKHFPDFELEDDITVDDLTITNYESIKFISSDIMTDEEISST